VPLFSITLVRTTSFSIYETSKHVFGRLLHHPLYYQPASSIPPRPRYSITPPYQGFFLVNASMSFLAGFSSGAFITVMACPFEFTKLASQIELLNRRKKLAENASAKTGRPVQNHTIDLRGVAPKADLPMESPKGGLPPNAGEMSMQTKGPFATAKEIYLARGVRGLYSGFSYHFGIPGVDQR
jgi:solute carrier family 25 (mitochondrial carnitine/acylcarnitine transporter), member 20/29